LKLSVLNPAFDDWHLSIENKICLAPSEMVAGLARVIKAVANETNQKVACDFSDLCAQVSVDDESLAVARSLASGRRSAIWLGNYAVQHKNAAQIHALSQEIARLLNSSFGVIGEAANSVGGYLAGAVPFGPIEGKNAAQMLSTPMKAYILAGVEPDLDIADGVSAVKSLREAEMVAALTVFKSQSLLDVADVLLPIAPFTETAGAFVNCEGRAQSFHPVTKSAGESRAGWKVLRVIGSALELDGFDFGTIEDVRNKVLGDSLVVDSRRLGNSLAIDKFALPEAVSGIQRIADIPIYFADPIVRRSGPLQATRDADAPNARMSGTLISKLGLKPGDKVRIKSEAGEVTVVLIEDNAVAAGCLRLAGGHGDTMSLGGLHGEVSVECA
jgi:NADH-quinone oxidoreductase subunit G